MSHKLTFADSEFSKAPALLHNSEAVRADFL